MLCARSPLLVLRPPCSEKMCSSESATATILISLPAGGVIFYGDKNNWWAAYALWVFTLFGHPDVRLLDGGRDLWVSNGRDTTLEVPSKQSTGYPVVERDDAAIRAFKDDVLGRLGGAFHGTVAGMPWRPPPHRRR